MKSTLEEAKTATLLTEEEVRHSWMFSLFDQNDDKEISYDELKLYMEFLGEYPTTEELKVGWFVALLFFSPYACARAWHLTCGRRR
jgi:hypothetical protein